jgi:hypothetical protein
MRKKRIQLKIFFKVEREMKQEERRKDDYTCIVKGEEMRGTNNRKKKNGYI